MCFSATASFVASAGLLGAGIISLREAKNSSHIPFAAISLIFCVQQFCEGMVWIFHGQDHIHTRDFFMYAFLIFAQVVWPVWIPFSMMQMEESQARKKTLLIFLLIGGGLAIYLAFRLIFHQFSLSVYDCHIRYHSNALSGSYSWTALFYCLAAVMPAFISGVKGMVWIGLLNLAALAVSRFFFEDHIISVWCFFAAIISIAIIFILRAQRTPPEGS